MFCFVFVCVVDGDLELGNSITISSREYASFGARLMKACPVATINLHNHKL